MPIKGIILLVIVAICIAVIFHEEIYRWVKRNFK
jgi:hypothetical protein